MRPSCLLLALLVAAPVRASTPANGWVVWASNRKDGRHEIYLAESDGTGVTRLTFNGGQMAGWSPDAKWIAYTHTQDSSTHVMRWTGKGDKQVCTGEFYFWMWDKSGLVCGANDSYHLVNPDTGAKQLLFKKSDFTRIGSNTLHVGGISHDGRWLVAQSSISKNGYTFDNGTFPKAYGAAVLLDFQNKGKIYYIGVGCEPTTPPAGDLVYHACGNGGPCASYPDLYKVSIQDIATLSSYSAEVAHDDADWGHEYFPRVSNDNKWLAYSASTGCHDQNLCDYEVFIHKLGAGNADRTRITYDTSNDQWPHLWVGTLPDVECSTAVECDDGDPCTKDTCTAGKCGQVAISGCCTTDDQCDDGSACTKDMCESNTCQHGPIPGCCATDSDCADTNPCTEDSCDSASGSCSNTKKADCCAVDTDCDDMDPCTLDSCDLTSNTCTHQPLCQADGGTGSPDAGVAADAGSAADAVTSAAQREPQALGNGPLQGGCRLVGGADEGWPWLALLLVALRFCRRLRRRD
jgi:hypothetical protein